MSWAAPCWMSREHMRTFRWISSALNSKILRTVKTFMGLAWSHVPVRDVEPKAGRSGLTQNSVVLIFHTNNNACGEFPGNFGFSREKDHSVMRYRDDYIYPSPPLSPPKRLSGHTSQLPATTTSTGCYIWDQVRSFDGMKPEIIKGHHTYQENGPEQVERHQLNQCTLSFTFILE